MKLPTVDTRQPYPWRFSPAHQKTLLRCNPKTVLHCNPTVTSLFLNGSKFSLKILRQSSIFGRQLSLLVVVSKAFDLLVEVRFNENAARIFGEGHNL